MVELNMIRMESKYDLQKDLFTVNLKEEIFSHQCARHSIRFKGAGKIKTHVEGKQFPFWQNLLSD